MARTFPCPKCGVEIESLGEVEVDLPGLIKASSPIFQCETCTMTTDWEGEQQDLPLTFILDKDGKPMDPADPEGKLRF